MIVKKVPPSEYDVEEGFILAIHHDCGSFVVNDSGYEERENLHHNRYFHYERGCNMNQENKSDQTIPYVRNGDYYLPDLVLPPAAGGIGFWGRRRREYLREHRPILFNQMALSGELFRYLALFNQEATERLNNLIQGMKAAQSITEELKARDQMAWAGAMNNIRACAEEIVYAELVYE